MVECAPTGVDDDDEEGKGSTLEPVGVLGRSFEFKVAYMND